MVVTLTDTNTSPLGTLTLDPEPDRITSNYARVPTDGIDILALVDISVPSIYDYKATSIEYIIAGAILSQSVKDLLEEYIIKKNVSGYRLTLPRNQSSGTAPFDETYRTVWITNVSLIDIGGTEKPYWLYNISFVIGEEP